MGAAGFRRALVIAEGTAPSGAMGAWVCWIEKPDLLVSGVGIGDKQEAKRAVIQRSGWRLWLKFAGKEGMVGETR